jgi:hypothetical protein
MMILKTVVLGIAAILGIFLIGAAFLPSSTLVSRSAVLPADPKTVYDLVADFHTWNSWSHWAKADPSQKVSISGPDLKIGSEMSWVGNKTGTGKMTITKLEEGTSLNSLSFDSTNGGTRFTWAFSSENTYPLGRWMGLMMQGMLGTAFENSQQNLKIMLEKK